jgi:hypothetical protein
MRKSGRTPCTVLVIVSIAVFCFALDIRRANGGDKKETELSADVIMTRHHKATKLDGAESLTTLIIYNAKGDMRVRKMAIISKLYDDGDTEKRLIRFIEPADVKGTGLLTYDYEREDDDIWFYMPALRKTRRIVSSEKAKSFMGSEFSYADMTPPPVEDFTHRILKTETEGGVECWVIESVPKTDEVAEENGFSKQICSIGKQDYMIRKAIYYDLEGELHKELVVEDIKEIDTKKHRYRPMYMLMVNKQDGRKSEAKVEAIKLRLDIGDDYFTTRYLERE